MWGASHRPFAGIFYRFQGAFSNLYEPERKDAALPVQPVDRVDKRRIDIVYAVLLGTASAEANQKDDAGAVSVSRTGGRL